MSTAAYEHAYQELIEPHRRELHAHCYRMLGSVQDAEDALQEALLRAWKAFDRFEGRAQPKTWLYRIATNTCLDAIARRKGKRELPIDRGPDEAPLTEIAYLEPYPDDPGASYERRESVELAFIAALQHLPATQRAVLILREVLGFSAKETAELLDTTPASVNSAMQRARAAVDERLPDQSQQATLQRLGDRAVADIVERYVEAWNRGDVDAVVHMLAEDATFSMPPNSEWFRGHDAIRAFLPTGPLSIPRIFVPTRANGQPAFGTYKLIDGEWLPNAIHVITLDDRGAIVDAVAFLDPALFDVFGLPGRPPTWRTH
ncbi:sigma-70 family RNA polymerase sigma factor [Solirubrobacter sp. CPCC 204708]|uniref:Sigma-70 family RNA polymerase sigma factor n=1 Tax=Solirubrobacter deserti TaxID=2282478 RepID=A0ABT4RH36_9ACTN|nr:sigma-70 family RNA polymerase sigma factor [Solirubrobacter deserti]MBE2315183.1 sigma-70 family RNA polymerase sigma factor [Solirubrobacter deserti]MDA0137866.1 sigma-70 family RNA polymerase sigma factor [Solirubrobacter deserti]